MTIGNGVVLLRDLLTMAPATTFRAIMRPSALIVNELALSGRLVAVRVTARQRSTRWCLTSPVWRTAPR